MCLEGMMCKQILHMYNILYETLCIGLCWDVIRNTHKLAVFKNRGVLTVETIYKFLHNIHYCSSIHNIITMTWDKVWVCLLWNNLQKWQCFSGTLIIVLPFIQQTVHTCTYCFTCITLFLLLNDGHFQCVICHCRYNYCTNTIIIIRVKKKKKKTNNPPNGLPLFHWYDTTLLKPCGLQTPLV